MRSEHRVLTPESVEFVFELAGLGTRMLAALIDHLLMVMMLVLVWLVACWAGSIVAMLGQTVAPVVGLLGSFAVYFGYFTFFEWRWGGQTPGKRLFDIRVIDDRGLGIDLFQSLIRNLFRLVDLMPALVPLDFVSVGLYGVGGLAALISPRHKRLGDWAAGTLVVRTRKRLLPGTIIAPSDKYNTLQEDPSIRQRIRTRLTLQEREMLLQLCVRRNELEFASRQSLFAEAAAFLEERLDVPREPFLSEEKFVQNIAAVALAGQESSQARNPGTPFRT